MSDVETAVIERRDDGYHITLVMWDGTTETVATTYNAMDAAHHAAMVDYLAGDIVEKVMD